MGGFGLPLPPDKQSAFARMLSGVKDYFGIGPLADVSEGDLWSKPVAHTRITRTPVYQTENLPKGSGGSYHASDPFLPTAHITVKPSELQNYPDSLIPHESGHLIYDKGRLSSTQVGEIPRSAFSLIERFPELYPPLPENQDISPQQMRDHLRMQADEGLAFSIGAPDATEFIERVASQIKDPAIAQQLRRLHYNAMRTKRLP